jgi:ABC-2 type transport system permease protein
MSDPTFRLAVRLRMRSTGVSALGMASVILMVGALFPAVGDSIGRLDLPDGVSDLLGGADYGSLVGWMRSEIGAVYGPLVVAAAAIMGAAGATAGEEEDRILGLVLAHPIPRSRLIVAKAAAVFVSVLIIAFSTWLGLVGGVAIGGGGIAIGNLAALALHLAFFGFAVGAFALALAAATGQKAIATGGAAAFAVVGFLVNGLAPLVDGLAWLRYLSPFHYYSGDDPLTTGVDLAGLGVLGAAALALTALAVMGFQRRDLRG